MKYQQILLISLLTISLSIKTKMSNKIEKSKKQDTSYADTITVESVSFLDNCASIGEGYYFLLEISQTSNEYPIILNDISIVQEDDNNVKSSCSCIGNKGSNILNCTLDGDLGTKSSDNNNKNFRVAKISDTQFDCYKSGSTTKEKCLLKGFDIDETITYHSLYDVLSSDQNHTYLINYENRDEGEIWVKFDTFLMGEGPQITLDGNEIKKCEEISYPDEEDEGEYIKCTVTKTQFPVEKYASYNVIVINQCGYEEYPGITVVITDNFSSWIKIGFSLLMLFVLF